MVSERPFKRRRTGARRRRPRGVVRGRIHRLSCCRWGTFHFRMDESIARWLVQKISMFQKSYVWDFAFHLESGRGINVAICDENLLHKGLQRFLYRVVKLICVPWISLQPPTRR
ncbi:uncharacterized protein LOC103703041 isoform X1 [Phoenix dactylifera]|uniref:Uncharacterized protein LOC103703041 isoform X1 n=1 Tax=Phoenix dactylifera TaxID=42345 RepID=A0A8B9AFA7_PHODC|nr:uncharacterized protein LOC103703041 isoform X1 [Phoenix dactylifera]